MNIDIERQTNTPLKEQVRLAIAQRIRSGLLAPGQRLPSVRQLADQMKISLVTAVQAYRLLENDGLVESIQGKGTFVASPQGPNNPWINHNSNGLDLVHQKMPANPFDWQLTIKDYLPRASFWSQSAVRLPPGILDLATASIHHSLLPLSLLNSSIQQSLREYSSSLGSYAPFQGDPEFLKVIVDYLKAQDLPFETHQLIVTNGTQQGIDLFARTFLGPGDVLAMETPAFSGSIDAFRFSHASIQPIPLDQDGIRIDMLEDLSTRVKIKAIYTVPTYQNPTGAVMSLRRRRQLVEFAEQNDILILEDEPHRELTLSRRNVMNKLPPPLKALDMTGRVVYLKGFSKFLFPGLRLGVIAADGTVYSRLLAAKSIVDLGSPLWLQKALIPFFKHSQLKSYIRKLNQVLVDRSDLVAGKLSAKLSPQVHWQKPSGGMHLWLTLPHALSADSLIPEAHHRGIHFLPGSIFYPGEPESHHLRICWTNLPDADLPKALDILCELLNQSV